jgi:hypothetical protein
LKQFNKGKTKIKCQEKNVHTSRISAAVKACMALESVCQQLTDVKYWPAAEKRGAISLPFPMNTEVKNNLYANIFMNSLFCGAIFLF